MQSPARARYSPLATMVWSSAYAAADRPARSEPATRIGSDSVQRIRTAPLSVWFAAAAERHLQRAFWHGRRVRRNRHRSEPGRDGGDVAFGQAGRDELHAVRFGGRPDAVTKGAELSADIVRPESYEAGNRRFHPGQLGAVTSRACRHTAGLIAFGHQRAPARQHGRTDVSNRLRQRRRAQGREVVRDLLQVRISLIFE